MQLQRKRVIQFYHEKPQNNGRKLLLDFQLIKEGVSQHVSATWGSNFMKPLLNFKWLVGGVTRLGQRPGLLFTNMCGAEHKTAIVVMTVKAVKMMRQNRSMTIAANFQSEITSSSSSWSFIRFVMNFSSFRMHCNHPQVWLQTHPSLTLYCHKNLWFALGANQLSDIREDPGGPSSQVSKKGA